MNNTICCIGERTVMYNVHVHTMYAHIHIMHVHVHTTYACTNSITSHLIGLNEQYHLLCEMYCVHVHTMHAHVHTMYVHVHTTHAHVQTVLPAIWHNLMNDKSSCIRKRTEMCSVHVHHWWI